MNKAWKQITGILLAFFLIVSGTPAGADSAEAAVNGRINVPAALHAVNPEETQKNVHNPMKAKPAFETEKSLIAEENTDPNGAYLVDFDTAYSAAITAEKEQRWFAVSAGQRMRITTFLVPPADTAVDMDVYFYTLNEETYNLELTAYSEQDPGKNEIVDLIVDPGIYYICVNGFKGSGDFAFIEYAQTQYLDKEINDSLSAATDAGGPSFQVTDTIGNPLDIDCYKFTVTGSGSNVTFNLSQPKGTMYNIFVSNSQGQLIKKESGEMESFDAGTYYVLVASGDGSCSGDRAYTLSASAVRRGDTVLSYGGYDLIRQGKDYYVNDKKITYDYLYQYHVDGGSGNYLDAVLKVTPGVNPTVVERAQNAEYGTMFVNYSTTFEDRSRSLAIYLPVKGMNYYYNRVGSGVLGPSAYETDDNIRADLIIDVNTGKVVDVCKPNWYYSSSESHHSYKLPEIFARIY